jgi:hypothetical protein
MGYADLDAIHRAANNTKPPHQWGDQVNDNIAYFKGAGFVLISLAGAWVNYGGSFSSAAWRRVGDLVLLAGMIKNGALPSTAFTLPVGARPVVDIQVPVASNGHYGQLQIAASTGIATAQVGDPGAFSLEGVIFSVA